MFFYAFLILAHISTIACATPFSGLIRSGSNIQARAEPTLEDCPSPPTPFYRFPPQTCIRLQQTHDVTFHRRADWLTLDPALQDPLVHAVNSGITRVLDYYEKLVKPLKVDLTLVEFVADAYVGKAYPRNGVCSVYIRWSKLPQKPLFVEFVTSHELYHCVQQQANPRRLPTEKESENWFLEGTANLFAYSFYQDQDMLEATEFEGLSIRAYDPSVPLHQQTYTTSLFFLYLNNKGWTREKIHQWVANRHFSADLFDEQAAISRDVEISDAFRTFTIAFHDKQIAFRYPSGLLIYIENKKEIETTSKAVNLARVSEKTTLELKVRPWAFAKYVVTLAAGQNIKVSDDIIRVGTKNTIWYRAKGLTAKWKELPSTGLTTGCRGSSIEYEFLRFPLPARTRLRAK